MKLAPLSVVSAGLALTGCGEEERRVQPTAPEVGAGSVITHVNAFQRVADRHGGNRAAGTPGDRASARYAVRRLRAAGYRVSTEPVRFDYFDEKRRPRLRGVRRVRTIRHSGRGRVRARVAAVNRACTRSDFSGFRRGRIAVARRGNCPFRIKARRAQRAGAAGLVVYNDGRPGQRGLISATLGRPGTRIPTVFVSTRDGLALTRRRAPVTLAVRAVSERRTTRNVVADSSFGSGKRVIVGGHLDSVPEGPGANDNASGSATVLAIAERQADDRTPGRRPLRVALWGAEEEGLVGSRRHARRLNRQQRGAIAAYVNLDMVGSANGGRFVYGSEEPIVKKMRSEARRVLAARGAPGHDTALRVGSDHTPFDRAGVPVFGLFSGASGRMSADEARDWGGRAGQPHDRCYHRRCDRAARLDRRTLDDLSRAAAAAVATALDPRKAGP